VFPINGLRPNGECNEQGIQLLPGSLVGGRQRRCEGATLDFDDREGALIGRNAKGIACSGAELAGASFTVRSYRNQTQQIHIQAVEDYTDPRTGEVRRAYRVVGTGASLCLQDSSRQLLWGLGIRPDLEFDSDPAPKDHVVIAVRSELYNLVGTAYEIESTQTDRMWLHLACVGDALAKRSLRDLHTDNLPRSRAALRMLTASYCGRHAMTVRDVEIEWGSDRRDLARDVEAAWTEHGAICVSKPRILYHKSNQATVPSDLPERLKQQCPRCGTDPEKWDQRIRTCSGSKVLPKCADAEAHGAPRRLKSYVRSPGA
jgi:hypothetical protein